MSLDDPITTGERLMSARFSSHLRLTWHERCDLDYILAVSMKADTLGGELYRLMMEFDKARAEVHRGPTLNGAELVLVIDRLKGLAETKQRLYSWALMEDTRMGFNQPDAVVATLVGRILLAFLEPNCHHCEGRGFTGSTHRGDPQVPCRPCRRSGHRREWIGRNHEETRFATHLLSAMQERMSGVDRAIRRFLSDDVAA